MRQVEDANRALMLLSKSLYNIVSKKINHFKEKAKDIRTAKTFDHITHPDPRIETIFYDIAQFVENSYGVPDEDLDITIISNVAGTWEFIKQFNDNHKHRDPGELFRYGSTAYESLQKGKPIFYPNKLRASKKKLYNLGEKDTDANGNGSIYVHPVMIECESKNGQSKMYEYLISIVTYQTPLASYKDKQEIKAAKTYLKQFSKRIEMELCLRSIKSYISDCKKHKRKTQHESISPREKVML